MGLKDVAKKMGSVRISKPYEIASEVLSKHKENLGEEYAREIVRQKLENSGFDYREFSEQFPYMIDKGNGILVAVSSKLVVANTSKKTVEKYANKLIRDSKPYDVIYCLPFQINGNRVRAPIINKVKNKMDIVFVDLPFNEKSLEKILG